MKKIINGKKYDTETAELLHEWHNVEYVTDFDYYSEELYRKRTGEYFLYGEGNARSKYAKAIGNNSWGGGEIIQPLTYEAARQWMEDHATADEYEAVFGEASEDGEDVAVTFRISTAARERLRKASEKTGKTQSAIIESLIETL